MGWEEGLKGTFFSPGWSAIFISLPHTPVMRTNSIDYCKVMGPCRIELDIHRMELDMRETQLLSEQCLQEPARLEGVQRISTHMCLALCMVTKTPADTELRGRHLTSSQLHATWKNLEAVLRHETLRFSTFPKWIIFYLWKIDWFIGFFKISNRKTG